jgi:signal transduction histidine kinase
LPEPLRAAHERIRAAAEHLLALVNDVLDLSKIEVGRMEVDLEVTDVGALLDSVVTVIEPIASAKGLHLDVIVGRDVPRLTTDARHVRQILLNLASNAIKFTERGSVTLIARRGDGQRGESVTIAVEDTGIGIATEDLARIFEEFEQVRPSGRGDSLQRGTGLGLAIARKLSRLLGGDIEVVSTEGVGSRFTLHLPLVAPKPVADKEAGGVTPTDGVPIEPDGGTLTPTTGGGSDETTPARDPDSDEHAAITVSRQRHGLDGHSSEG